MTFFRLGDAPVSATVDLDEIVFIDIEDKVISIVFKNTMVKTINYATDKDAAIVYNTLSELLRNKLT